MENFRYVKFGFSSTDNYLIYNKLPLPKAAEKSAPNVLETEVNEAPEVPEMEDHSGDNVEVFDSSNFETFKEPTLPAPRKPHILESRDDFAQQILKKSQPEDERLKGLLLTNPSGNDQLMEPTDRRETTRNLKSNNLNFYIEKANNLNDSELSYNTLAEPVTILTDTQRFSGPLTPALLPNKQMNGFKDNVEEPKATNRWSLNSPEKSKPMKNLKRVSFTPSETNDKTFILPQNYPNDEKSLDIEFNEIMDKLKEKENPVPRKSSRDSSFSPVKEKESDSDELAKLRSHIHFLETEKEISDANLKEVKIHLEEAEKTLEQYADQVLKPDDADLIEAKKDIVKLQAQLVKQNAIISDLQKNSSLTQNLSTVAAQDNSRYRQAIEGYKENIQQLQGELDNSKSEISNLKLNIEKTQFDNRSLEEQLKKMRENPLSNFRDQTGEKMLIDRKYLDGLKQTNLDLERTLQDFQSKIPSQDTTTKLREARYQFEEKERELRDLQLEKKATESKLATALRNYNEALSHIEALDFRLKSPTSNDQLEKKLQALDIDNGNMSNTIAELKNKIFVLERENDSLKRTQQANGRDLKLLEENIHKSQNMRLQDQHTLQDMKDRIEELEEQCQSNLKKAENFKNLLNNTLNLNDKLNRVKADIQTERDDYLVRIKKLEKELELASPMQAVISANQKYQNRSLF
jgi:hypothetical protein